MLKKAAVKKTTFGADLIEGMKLVLAHQRGKIELEQVWPKPTSEKATRKGRECNRRERVHDIEVEIKPLVAPPSSPQSGR